MRPLKFGNLEVPVPVVLAPMAGYTDTAFRSLCREFDCGMVVTEIVNSDGIIRMAKPTFHYLEMEPGEKPVGAHIYGHDPVVMAEAAGIIDAMGKFDYIDINCGCPAHRIVARGAGSALMRDPSKVEKMVAGICRAVKVPVTLKTRIGFSMDNLNVSEVAHAVESAGASAIAIHGRVASVKHSGEADWGMIARVKSERKIPVIGNGGVNKPEDGVEMFRQTGVDAIMVGRAAIGNPWFFRDIHQLLLGNPKPPPPSLEERRRVLTEHLRRQVALAEKELLAKRKSHLTADTRGALSFRGHLVKYFHGFPGGKAQLRRLNSLASTAEILTVVDALVEGRTESLPPPGETVRAPRPEDEDDFAVPADSR